ncbi:MAG: hypothetical protein ABIP91_02920 [Sphingomicrobium sp.]
MRRRVKDFIEIGDYTSLDQLIGTLSAIHDSLPPDAEPELRLRGDDVFGRRLSITYFRELSAEEVECEARYAAATLPEDNAAIDGLREQLDDVAYEQPKRRIRRVA